MTRQSLMKLNKISLVKTIEQLEKENRLLKQDIMFTCNECLRTFDYNQVEVIDYEGNVLCPYCNCGDISKEIIK